MCLDCGCHEPLNDHGDRRHLLMADLQRAADASGGITLLQAAVNILATVQDATGDCLALDVMKAEGEEQRYVLGVAYQPGPDPQIAKGVDGGRDYFTEAELEKAAWSFLRNGPRVGAFHMDGTDSDGGMATVTESYIYRGPDWDLGDGIVVRKGTWLIGAILNERAWDLHKAGRLNGWSPQGVARRRRVVKR